MKQTKAAIPIYNEPVADIIRRRRSVRTYKETVLKPDDRDLIIGCFDSLKGPFGSDIRYAYLEKSSEAMVSGGKLGTYGIIKGAGSFVAPVICRMDDAAGEKTVRAVVDVGYCFEKLILYATSLGIATCWLGGSFSRYGFAKAAGLMKNEILPVISPFGYMADKKSLVENLIYRGAGSKNRKDWSELFFDGSFDRSLSKENAGAYMLPLEMVRLAPSSSNKQPWRIVREDETFHFYLKKAAGYGVFGYDMQKIDMGIAMCHFELTAAEAGLQGIWLDIHENGGTVHGYEYIVSWKCVE